MITLPRRAAISAGTGGQIDLDVFDLAAHPSRANWTPALDNRGLDVVLVGGCGRHRTDSPPRVSNGSRLAAALLLSVAVNAAIAQRSLAHAHSSTSPAAVVTTVLPTQAPRPLQLDSQWTHQLEQTCRPTG